MNIINKISAFVVIVMFLATAGCEKKVELQKFSSKAGRFTIMAPGQLEKETHTLNTDVGSVRLVTFMINNPHVSYLVSYVDYPREAIENSDPDTMLAGARNGMLEKIDGKLISEERIAYDKDPAVEIHYTAKGNAGIGHTVLLLSGTRLYQVGAIGAKDQFPAEAVKQYINSFEIW